MPIQYTEASPAQLHCPVCQVNLEVRMAKGRRSGKAFLMVVCPMDGRHFRGFINDADYVAQVLQRLDAQSKPGKTQGPDPQG